MKRPKPVTNPKLYPVRMHLLLSTEQYRKLAEMANASQCSMGAVLRQLVSDYSAREKIVENNA